MLYPDRLHKYETFYGCGQGLTAEAHTRHESRRWFYSEFLLVSRTMQLKGWGTFEGYSMLVLQRTMAVLRHQK